MRVNKGGLVYDLQGPLEARVGDAGGWGEGAVMSGQKNSECVCELIESIVLRACVCYCVCAFCVWPDCVFFFAVHPILKHKCMFFWRYFACFFLDRQC